MLWAFIDYKYRLRIMFITFFVGINSKLKNWYKKGIGPSKRIGWPTSY
jgi:hypothetical protein